MTARRLVTLAAVAPLVAFVTLVMFAVLLGGFLFAAFGFPAKFGSWTALGFVFLVNNNVLALMLGSAVVSAPVVFSAVAMDAFGVRRDGWSAAPIWLLVGGSVAVLWTPGALALLGGIAGIDMPVIGAFAYLSIFFVGAVTTLGSELVCRLLYRGIDPAVV